MLITSQLDKEELKQKCNEFRNKFDTISLDCRSIQQQHEQIRSKLGIVGSRWNEYMKEKKEIDKLLAKFNKIWP